MGKIINIFGQKFGKLVVVEYAGVDSNRRAIWLCKCDCGNNVDVIGKHLRRGDVVSCGCSKIERMRSIHDKTRINITGQRFGKLTAVRSYVNRDVPWRAILMTGS
jgi:hypothetical protein